MSIFPRLLLGLVLCALTAHAQRGDRSDSPEKQVSRVPADKIPPSPVLAPEAALKSFKLQPGFRIELVASEPLVHDPVHSVFDPEGRLWVVEMSGYMHDFIGTGEQKPVGKIAVLEDTNGDGRMDKRTEFVDGLVMPHSVSVVRDGILVGEPPNLWFCQDTNADLKCDQKTLVATDYGNRINPEHTANGLMWARDNWIYSAGWTFRLRSLADGTFRRDPTVPRGQYGISQDDEGRLVYNSNSDQFRIDLVPSRYLQRNPNFRSPMGLNVDPIRNQATFPIRVTPGVNRGYRVGTLRPDGTLATFTAACSPLIYRGDQFPQEFYGNAFVCEPSGNLVKRNILWEEGGTLRGRQAYANSEFLASTDERFRPVHLSDGPDGALYITDFYRGVIQHHTYLTTYLREQSDSRKLQQPVGFGRIYRVVADGKKSERTAPFARLASPQLVSLLSSPNGWVRDNAQRLLVERNDSEIIPALKELGNREFPAAAHALWTLEGMGRIDLGTALKALAHSNSKVRAAAVRLSEPLLRDEDGPEVLSRLSALSQTEPSAEVQLQLAFTLAETVGTEPVLADLAARFSTNIYIRHAVLSGLGGRETKFLELLLADKAWREDRPGRGNLLHGLAQCVLVSRRADDVTRLLELTLTARPWQRSALLDGAGSVAPEKKNSAPPKLVRFSGEPAAWKKINALKEKDATEKLKRVAQLITWPGKPGYVPPPKLKPLSPEEQFRFDAGKQLYAASCAGCHQLSGLGMEGLAPPLADSEWVVGSEQRLTQIVLLGVRGPITVKGRRYSLEMPGLGGSFDDEQIASVLTYIRREWDHGANPVSPVTIKKTRTKVSKRNEAWTEAELLKVP